MSDLDLNNLKVFRGPYIKAHSFKIKIFKGLKKIGTGSYNSHNKTVRINLDNNDVDLEIKIQEAIELNQIKIQ